MDSKVIFKIEQHADEFTFNSDATQADLGKAFMVLAINNPTFKNIIKHVVSALNLTESINKNGLFN